MDSEFGIVSKTWIKEKVPPLLDTIKWTDPEISETTIDGRNPKQPPGMYKTIVNNGITYQPQLVFSPDFFLQLAGQRKTSMYLKI